MPYQSDSEPEQVAPGDPILRRFRVFGEGFRSSVHQGLGPAWSLRIWAGVMCAVFGVGLLLLSVVMIAAGIVALVMTPFRKGNGVQ